MNVPEELLQLVGDLHSRNNSVRSNAEDNLSKKISNAPELHRQLLQYIFQSPDERFVVGLCSHLRAKFNNIESSGTVPELEALLPIYLQCAVDAAPNSKLLSFICETAAGICKSAGLTKNCKLITAQFLDAWMASADNQAALHAFIALFKIVCDTFGFEFFTDQLKEALTEKHFLFLVRITAELAQVPALNAAQQTLLLDIAQITLVLNKKFRGPSSLQKHANFAALLRGLFDIAFVSGAAAPPKLKKCVLKIVAHVKESQNELNALLLHFFQTLFQLFEASAELKSQPDLLKNFIRLLSEKCSLDPFYEFFHRSKNSILRICALGFSLTPEMRELARDDDEYFLTYLDFLNDKNLTGATSILFSHMCQHIQGFKTEAFEFLTTNLAPGDAFAGLSPTLNKQESDHVALCMVHSLTPRGLRPEDISRCLANICRLSASSADAVVDAHICTFTELNSEFFETEGLDPLLVT